MVMRLLSRKITSASPSMFFSAPSKALHEPGRVSLSMETKWYKLTKTILEHGALATWISIHKLEQCGRKWKCHKNQEMTRLLLWSLQYDLFHACFHQSNFATAVRSGMYISASGGGSHRQCDLSYQNPMSSANESTRANTEIVGSLVPFDSHQQVMKV